MVSLGKVPYVQCMGKSINGGLDISVTFVPKTFKHVSLSLLACNTCVEELGVGLDIKKEGLNYGYCCMSTYRHVNVLYTCSLIHEFITCAFYV